MKVYVVNLIGSNYDEVYNEIELVTTSKKRALDYIEKQKGRTMSSVHPLYAYLQTWEKEVKINEKEFGL